VARGEPLYIVDNLRLTTQLALSQPRAVFVVDIGDEAASLAHTKGRSPWTVAGLFVAQRLVERRARGVVVRGVGHLAALASCLPRRPYCVVPDVCQPPEDWAPRQREDGRLTLGFVGSSHLSPKAPPAGWELPELLTILPPSVRGVAVVAGTGEAYLRSRAAELGVAARLEVVPGLAHHELRRVLADVDVCISTQTTHLAGQVRTTAKLVEYLALGKIVLASRVGTAAAILPPMLTVDRDDVFSAAYVKELARRVEVVSQMPEAELLGLQRHSRSLATTLFSAAALGPVWLDKMREWEVLP